MLAEGVLLGVTGFLAWYAYRQFQSGQAARLVKTYPAGIILWFVLFNVCVAMYDSYMEAGKNLKLYRDDAIYCMSQGNAETVASSTVDPARCQQAFARYRDSDFGLAFDIFKSRGFGQIVMGFSVGGLLDRIANSHVGYLSLFVATLVPVLAFIYLIVKSVLLAPGDPAPKDDSRLRMEAPPSRSPQLLLDGPRRDPHSIVVIPDWTSDARPCGASPADLKLGLGKQE